MPGHRGAGMDHSLYEYAPFPQRGALTWPGDARLAWMVVVHVDWWELMRAPGTHRPPGAQGPWGNLEPDWRTFTYREFGHRIGIFRVLDAIDRFRIRPTIALGAEAARRYPAIVRACADRGFEFAAHGTHATRMITSKMSEDEERRFIEESIEALEQATGTRPAGWIGQDFGESPRTPDLLRKSGLDWFCDWPNDDQPTRFRNGLVSLPYQSEWDDVQALWMKLVPTWDYPGLVADAADCLTREGGRMMSLHVRPWLLGQPGRIRYLEAALADLAGRHDLWHATAGQIARHTLECGR